MFKRLKRQLLLFNIFTFSALLLGVFGSLYLSTYIDVTTRIDDQLERIVNTTGSPSLLDETIRNDAPITRINNEMFGTSLFVVLENDELVFTSNHFIYTESDVQNIVELTNSSDGNVKYEGAVLQYLSVQEGDYLKIAYIDASRDYELLNSSIVFYMIIFFVSLAGVAFLSNFMTNRSIKPIKDSYDKQKDFVANASHELKTPLTIIGTNVDILLADEYKGNKWLKYIKSEVSRMNKLTHDLLYLANADNIDKAIVSKFNAAATLEPMMLGIEVLCFEKKINLDYKLANTEISFNEEQFKQVAMILIDNAVKYTPEKGTIEVELKETGKSVELIVRNTGTGISPEDLQHIFDRFYKADKARTSNGSYGLGLSIAKTIIDNHNAKIKVKSEEGKYTEFRIIL